MPRRTNDFQRLIKLIHESLAPEGATVTESNLVLDSDTGDLREVDITVELVIGTDRQSLLIECRDHKRSQTVEWIEQLIGKFQDRTGRAIIAVSRQGFTSTAKRKAMRHNILALSIEDATDAGWLADVKSFPNLTITLGKPELAGVDVKLINKSLSTADFPPMRPADTMVRGANGRNVGTPADLYQSLVDRDLLVGPMHRKKGLRADGLIEVGLRLESGAYFEARGIAFPVEGIVFLVRPNEETLDLSVRAGTYGDTDVATSTGRTKFWRVQFAVVRGGDGKPRLSLSVQPANGSFPDGVMRLYGLPDE